MSRFYKLILVFTFSFFLIPKQSYAFLQRVNEVNTPFFVDAKKGMWYIGPGAGMLLYGSQNFNGYSQDSAIDSLFTTNSRLQYSPYLTAIVGYKPFDYNFRFELSFEYMHSLGTNMSFDTPQLIGGNYVKTIAASMQRFRLGGNIYYQIDTPFTISSKSIGFFFGFGAGISINKVYIHDIANYASSDPNSTISTVNTADQFMPTTSGSEIISTGPAVVALYLDFAIGTTIDMSETILVQLKAKYSITTKPVLNENLGAGTSNYDGNILKNQIIGMEMAILFRTN